MTDFELIRLVLFGVFSTFNIIAAFILMKSVDKLTKKL